MLHRVLNEKDTLEVARRLKANNPKVKVLAYLSAMEHNGAKWGEDPTNGQFNQNWAMTKRGDPLWQGRKHLTYNHKNLNFREWWIRRALDMASHDEIDGLFIDDIDKVNHYQLPNLRGHEKAYLATASELRKRLPGEKILIGNALKARLGNDGNLGHLDYLDGAYVENWNQSRNHEPTLDLMTAALKMKKIVVISSTSSKWNNRWGKGGNWKLDFPLAFFLLIVEPHAYFSCPVGTDAILGNDIFDDSRFETVMQKLGKPIGSYVKEGANEFSREFEHFTVKVVLRSRKGTLTFKDRRGATKAGARSLNPNAAAFIPLFPQH